MRECVAGAWVLSAETKFLKRVEMKPVNDRGFYKGEWTDAYGARCSIQESSLVADEGHIWLGCNDIGLKRFEPGKGWTDVELEQNNGPGGVHHSANTRMHLSQSMVRDLLPLLQHFAEHGDLPKMASRGKGSFGSSK